jgi:thiamine-phosphate pyrophosphorylase
MMTRETLLSRRDRLAAARLCVLVDGGDSAESCAQQVAAVAAAGAGLIQLRDKKLSDAALLERAIAAVAAARRHGALLVVNDRPDIAVASAADGVHLGEDDLPVLAARRVVGSARLIGRTAHTPAEAHAAVSTAADYLGVGPCFPSDTKAFETFAPRAFLEEVAREIDLPSFAIGGITAERIGDLLALGLSRVAVGASVTRAADPRVAVQELLHHLGGPPATPTDR